MKVSKAEVLEFLEEFGTRVSETPRSSADVWCDDHICIKYNRTLWYVKEDHMMYTQWQEELVEYLEENYLE